MLQLNEPGMFPAKIDLSQCWGPDHTVVIGVAREGVGPNHIAFRKPAGFLSRRQVTLMAMDGNDNKLVARDGGKDSNGMWSCEWKHTFIDGRKLSNNEWVPFTVGSRLRFHPEKPPTSGYCVHLVYDDTDNTHGLDTVKFDTVQAWSAISRASQGTGTLLLSAPSDDGIAIIIRLDANAERLLGAETGELKEIEESCILNNLLPVGPTKEQLMSHVKDAIVYPGQAFYGVYDFGAGPVRLRLENRRINNQSALLGWLVPNEPIAPGKPHPSIGDWRTEIVVGAVQWAKDNPRLAVLVGIVVGIAIAVIRIFGD